MKAVFLVALLVGLAACGVLDVKKTERLPPEKTLPLRTATLDELLEKLRQQEASVTTINAVAELQPSTGSAYSGVIEEYHDVRTFILAERRPASAGASGEAAKEARTVRLIGQAPVVRKTIFDMVADEDGFRVLIPPKNKFIVGPNEVRRLSSKPIENLRPQHLFDALFPAGPQAGAVHLFEENEFNGERFYAVTEILPAEGPRWRLGRRWWFERSQLELVRLQRFDPEGRLVTDVHYAEWRSRKGTSYPKTIELVRPQEDYRLTLIVKEITLNEPLDPEKFRLEQPPGVELVDLSKPAQEEKP